MTSLCSHPSLREPPRILEYINLELIHALHLSVCYKTHILDSLKPSQTHIS